MRPPIHFPDPLVLDRYLAGDATDEERQLVDQWFAANPDQQELLAAVRAGVAQPQGAVPAYDRAARVASIVDYSVRAARRIRRESDVTYDRPAAHSLSYKVLATRSRPMAWYAAAVAALVAFVIFGLGQLHRFQPPSLSHLATSTYATGNGERATITLADGSTVMLNVASRLQVPADFAAGNRTVHLQGEALFTVAHHRGVPFTVIAGPSTTRVLGTSFLVRHYNSDTAATIAVRTGKVSVQSHVLSSAQQITVGTRGPGQVHTANPDQFSFASGMLMLDNVPLTQAIPELDRWYDADIRLGDASLATQKVIGGFKAGSLTDLAGILELTFNVRVVRDGQTLTLYPRS